MLVLKSLSIQIYKYWLCLNVHLIPIFMSSYLEPANYQTDPVVPRQNGMCDHLIEDYATSFVMVMGYVCNNGKE